MLSGGVYDISDYIVQGGVFEDDELSVTTTTTTCDSPIGKILYKSYRWQMLYFGRFTQIKMGTSFTDTE